MINIPQKFSFTLLLLASLLFAGTLTASAAIDIDDDSTYYNVDNWYVTRSGGTPTISSSGTSILISGFKFDALALCYFDSVSLAVGQTISVSGTINLSGLSTDTRAITVISLADSRDYSQAALNSALEEAGLGHAIKSDNTDFTATKIGGSMAGFVFSPATFYNRNTADRDSIVSTSTGGTTIEKDLTFSTPTAGTDYNFEISITKTGENTYSGSGSFNGEDEVLFEDQENTLVSKFDVLAFKVPVGTGTSYTTTISNLVISVIPEPSLCGLFAGTLVLALAGTRRRRKK